MVRVYAEIFEVVQQAAGQGNNPVAQGGPAVVAQAAILQVHNVFDDPTTHPFRNCELSSFPVASVDFMAICAAAPDTQHVDR